MTESIYAVDFNDGSSPISSHFTEWGCWDDWIAYNLDATWRIAQGSCERVRGGKTAFLKTFNVREGEIQ